MPEEIPRRYREAGVPPPQSIDDLELRDLLKLVFVSNQDIAALLAAQNPVGYERPLELTVSGPNPVYVDQSYKMPDGAYFDPPYIAADVYNAGPDPVYVRVNSRDIVKTAALPAQGFRRVDTRLPRLRSMMLWNLQGKSSDVTVLFSR